MTFLLDSELNEYYPRATPMGLEERRLYLARANSYAFGYIGGVPLYSAVLPVEPLKAAVAAAFEILAKGETGADVNAVNGNITEAAPGGFYARTTQYDPLDSVKVMLEPYKAAVALITQDLNRDKGIRFL